MVVMMEEVEMVEVMQETEMEMMERAGQTDGQLPTGMDGCLGGQMGLGTPHHRPEGQNGGHQPHQPPQDVPGALLLQCPVCPLPPSSR